jgi:hypothetical protein
MNTKTTLDLTASDFSDDEMIYMGVLMIKVINVKAGILIPSQT